ncbi:MAG: 3'(2'),5'-bisphosphate nucleotidase CysQ [Pseudomonadota bacterium]|nr:3'(2'),5'-bisphosphate nucleotidase CysQ [Pseudomonadota bacterium]
MRSQREELELLIEAARGAAEIAMSYFGRSPEVWMKAGHSPVSEADYAVDRYLKSVLLAARPGYGWVSEESEQPRTGNLEDAQSRFFVVDPIDGTRAYLRGEATWCVSLALVSKGRPVAGVIHAPALSEVFLATEEGAATCNGRPIEVGQRWGEGAGEALSVAMPDQLRGRFERLDPPLRDAVTPAKAVPSLAYRLALVADGRLDATLIRPRCNDWDIAAGDLILKRAGGRLVDTNGQDILYSESPNRHGVLIAASEASQGLAMRLAEGLAPITR